MAIINRSRWIQIGWLVAIWSASVATLGVVAYVLRWLLQP
jgi:hypothetical protein